MSIPVNPTILSVKMGFPGCSLLGRKRDAGVLLEYSDNATCTSGLNVSRKTFFTGFESSYNHRFHGKRKQIIFKSEKDIHIYSRNSIFFLHFYRDHLHMRSTGKMKTHM